MDHFRRMYLTSRILNTSQSSICQSVFVILIIIYFYILYILFNDIRCGISQCAIVPYQLERSLKSVMLTIMSV